MSTLMVVHAHPDDEVLTTGGILARYADRGVRTVLVTCTGGEAGEIAQPQLANRESLGAVRRRELRSACRVLGVARLHLLGYRDSGMAGSPDNDHPASFQQASLAEATAKLVALIRQERPEVIVTYDEAGFYGHPDHVQANRITQAAFAAAPAERFVAVGPRWQPLRLYYTAYPHSGIIRGARRLLEAGISPPFEPVDGQAPPFGTADELITTRVDVAALTDRKRRALWRHASQMNPDFFLSQLSPTLFRELFATESFRLVKNLGQSAEPTDDLFGGLAGRAA